MLRLNRSPSALRCPGLVLETLEERCLLSTWTAPLNLGPKINSDFAEAQPALSPDGLSLYFNSGRPGGYGGNDLWVSRRATVNDAWGEPQNLGKNINSPSGECCPAFSTDGHWLFFGSNRPGGFGGFDIYASWRDDPQDDFGWMPAFNLGAGVNSGAAEVGPGYFADTQTGTVTLYFASQNRPGGLGGNDIYASTLKEDGTFGPATLIVELSSPFDDRRPAMRGDGLEVFFPSNRPGGIGDVDIWVATRATTKDVWSKPVNLGAPVNTPFADDAPSLSAEGDALYFHSNQPGGFGLADLYVSRRQVPQWGEPVNLGPKVNTEANDRHPAISPDGLSLYISTTRPDGFGGLDMWVSRRASLHDPWETPQNLGEILNTDRDDFSPAFSTDGHWLFLCTGRKGGYGDNDIWASYREDPTDDYGWQPPVNLGPEVNSSVEDCGPTPFADPKTGTFILYFTSARLGGAGDHDIYASILQKDGLFGPAVPVKELNSPNRDTRTAIRADGLEMFLTSNRSGGLGGLDIWVSTRKSTLDPWSAPINLGEPVNTSFADGAPALSTDGNTMYFYSDRPGGVGSFDLYVTTREGRGGGGAPQPGPDNSAPRMGQAEAANLLTRTVAGAHAGSPIRTDARRTNDGVGTEVRIPVADSSSTVIQALAGRHHWPQGLPDLMTRLDSVLVEVVFSPRRDS